MQSMVPSDAVSPKNDSVPSLNFRKDDRILVVAPHPDDDVLGCGAAIAKATTIGCKVGIVYVTDGSASHIGSPTYPPRRLRELRENEAELAAALLGVSAKEIRYLREPDSGLADSAYPLAQLKSRLRHCIMDFKPNLVFGPWIHDRHADHATVAKLLRSVLAELPAIELFEYDIWPAEAAVHQTHGADPDLVSLNVASFATRKQLALQAHQSQLGKIIHDAEQSFELPAPLRDRATESFENFVKVGPVRRAAKSLSRDYFDQVYAAEIDPWQFATSPYEAEKYATTIAFLGDRRFENAFEIGCSIGVLTQLLAPHCRQLLAVDTNEKALHEARARNRDQGQVEFAIADIPRDFPQGHYDLIMISEVAYYWDRADDELARAAIANALEPNGLLVLVHYLPYVADYPRTGDEVHAAFLGDQRLRHLRGTRKARYRVDVLTRA